MKTYVITRANGWGSKKELEAAATLSSQVGNEQMADRVRWIRSYVTRHEGGRIGTVCIYQATNPDAVREHARRVGMPADAITEIADTVIIRPDPTIAA
jgi:sporulation protein YlmC with PRC-barrel domain